MINKLIKIILFASLLILCTKIVIAVCFSDCITNVCSPSTETSQRALIVKGPDACAPNVANCPLSLYWRPIDANQFNNEMCTWTCSNPIYEPKGSSGKCELKTGCKTSNSAICDYRCGTVRSGNCSVDCGQKCSGQSLVNTEYSSSSQFCNGTNYCQSKLQCNGTKPSGVISSWSNYDPLRDPYQMWTCKNPAQFDRKIPCTWKPTTGNCPVCKDNDKDGINDCAASGNSTIGCGTTCDCASEIANDPDECWTESIQGVTNIVASTNRTPEYYNARIKNSIDCTKEQYVSCSKCYNNYCSDYPIRDLLDGRIIRCKQDATNPCKYTACIYEDSGQAVPQPVYAKDKKIMCENGAKSCSDTDQCTCRQNSDNYVSGRTETTCIKTTYSVDVYLDKQYIQKTVLERGFRPTEPITPFDDIICQAQISNPYDISTVRAKIISYDTIGNQFDVTPLTTMIPSDEDSAKYKMKLTGWNNGWTADAIKIKYLLLSGKAKCQVEITRNDNTKITKESIGFKVDGCVHIRGSNNANFRMVNMYGKSIGQPLPWIITTSINMVNNGFNKIDPFKTYKEYFSHYADLIEHDDTQWPMINSGESYADSSDKKVKELSSCTKNANVYYFYNSRVSTPYVNIAMFPKGVAYLKNTNELEMLHETGHAFAALNDEYLLSGAETGTVSTWNVLTAAPGKIVIPGKNCKYPANWGEYGDIFRGCSGSANVLIRPSLNSIMKTTYYGNGDKYNTVSCGYILAKIKGGKITDNWKECAQMDTIKITSCNNVADCTSQGETECMACVQSPLAQPGYTKVCRPISGFKQCGDDKNRMCVSGACFRYPCEKNADCAGVCAENKRLLDINFDSACYTCNLATKYCEFPTGSLCTRNGASGTCNGGICRAQ